MIRILKSFAAKLWLALVLLIVLGGLFILTTRMLLPIATEYRQEVEELVSNELGQKVEIGELDTRWRGYGPELVLDKVVLRDPETGKSALRISQIHIGIGLLDSLRNRAITPRQITFYGTRLLIKRRSDGSVVLAGLENLEESSGDSSDTFLLPFRISMKQSEIFWENQSIGAAPVRFTDVEFTITNGENRHQIEASMRLPEVTAGNMHLKADIKGDFQKAAGWSGEVYLKGDQLAMATILKDRMPEGSQFRSGSASMELWSSWEKGRLQTLEGAVDFQKLNLSVSQPDRDSRSRSLEIAELGSNFKWQRSKSGWSLDVADIKFARSGKAWPESGLSLLARYGEWGNLNLRAGMKFVRVKDIQAIIRLFPLPSPDLDRAINNIQPEADIHNLQLSFEETLKGPVWSGRGELQNITMEPWREIPGITGLNAKFWLNQGGGTAELGGSKIVTRFPELFRNDITLNRLMGRVHWRQKPDEWQIFSNGLIANNQDLSTKSRIQLRIPTDSSKSIHMDMQSDFRNGNGSSTSKYLPASIMNEDAVEWLDSSIISGRVTEGSALFRGPLDKFPFEDKSGHFEVLFRLKDGVLDFDPEWPNISNINAEIRFHNNSMDIWASKGRMYKSILRNLHVQIADLENASPLKISGYAEGPLSDQLQLLRETPLEEDFGVLARQASSQGRSDLYLNLTIPLDEGDYKVSGKLNFKDSSLKLKQADHRLTHIRGTLGFNENGIRAKGINARILGEKIKVDISTQEKSGTTTVKANGSITGSKLAKAFPNKGLKLLEGRSKWHLKLTIPSLTKNKGKLYTRVTATSNLVGTKINQPAPIGKTTKQKRTLRLESTISAKPSKQVRLSYGKVLDSDLYFSSNKKGEKSLTRGSLVLGGKKAKAPKQSTLLLRGGLNNINLTPWMSLAAGGDGGINLPPISAENLRFGQLQLGDTILKNAKLSFSEGKHAINGKISSDVLSGRVSIPKPYNTKPIIISLDRLAMKLDPDELSKQKAKTATPTDTTDPRTLPAISLSSKKLVINGVNFGPMKLTTKRIKEGLKLEQMRLTSKRLNMSARGNWTIRGKDPRTSIQIKAKTDSMGKLLKALGFAPNLKGAPADINANLNWRGSPRQFKNTDLSGRMKMEIGKGRFLEVNPGLGRVFGLLNISALQRRLTLDFSDTFKKGFSFDKAEGSFELDLGDAYTNDLRIESPSALIEITGRTGLVSQDFDQLVTVTPSISTTLPVAATIAGGPAAGAAALLMQKILGKHVDKVSTTRYSITGSWDKPNIDKLKPPRNQN